MKMKMKNNDNEIIMAKYENEWNDNENNVK